MKRLLAIVLAGALAVSLTACGKSETMKTYEDSLAAVGEVTADSEEAIIAVEKAFEALSEDEKEKVGGDSTIISLREDYEEALLLARVQHVESLIDAIGEVTMNSESAIKKAQAAFNDLTNEEKSRVSAEHSQTYSKAYAEYQKALEAHIVESLQGTYPRRIPCANHGPNSVELTFTDNTVNVKDYASLQYSDMTGTFTVDTNAEYIKINFTDEIYAIVRYMQKGGIVLVSYEPNVTNL